MFELILTILGAAVIIAIYVAPIIIARKRDCKDLIPIFVLTLLAGWTILFWFGALWWSLVGESFHEPNRWD